MTGQDEQAIQIDSSLELMNRFQEPEVRSLLSQLSLPVGSRGVDVGCGVGLYALWLADVIGPAGRILAIDPSAERIAEAEQRINAAPQADRINLRLADGTAIDEPDDSFDWVWCSDVLHHIEEGVMALKEFARIVRPGGRILIKESQVLRALLLPGHLDLERQLQRADVEFQKQEAGEHSFQERRQRTYQTMLQAGLCEINVRTIIVQRQAPLDNITKQYLQKAIFDRTWGPRLRPWLDAHDWERRSALCEADSPQSILARPDYYCIYPLTLFAAHVPEMSS